MEPFLKDYEDVVEVNVKKCASCGKHHWNMEFKKMEFPIVNLKGHIWRYSAICPVTQVEVYMRPTGDDEI